MDHYPAVSGVDANIHITRDSLSSPVEGETSQLAISADGRRCITEFCNDASGHTDEVVVHILSSTKGDGKVDFKTGRGADQPKWINENLLFLRIWWGHRWGTDYIFNADTDLIVYREGFSVPYLPALPSGK